MFLILKLNNYAWKKVQNYFFVEKNDAQNSGFAVVKKAWKKFFLKKKKKKKNPSSLFVQIRPTKRCTEIF